MVLGGDRHRSVFPPCHSHAGHSDEREAINPHVWAVYQPLDGRKRVPVAKPAEVHAAALAVAMAAASKVRSQNCHLMPARPTRQFAFRPFRARCDYPKRHWEWSDPVCAS